MTRNGDQINRRDILFGIAALAAAIRAAYSTPKAYLWSAILLPAPAHSIQAN